MAEAEESKKVRSNVVLEVYGKPKEHIEKAIKMYLEKIKGDENKIVILNENIHDAAEQKDGFFSTFAELEIISEDLPTLIGFCFDYMPSSVEILAPENMKMSGREITHLINDLQAKLHSIDMTLKTTKTENEFLRRNMNTLIRNLVIVSLKHKPMSLDELSKLTGIKDDELKSFLATLIKLDKLKEDNSMYFLKNE
jgi:hypothetical protein